MVVHISSTNKYIIFTSFSKHSIDFLFQFEFFLLFYFWSREYTQFAILFLKRFLVFLTSNFTMFIKCSTFKFLTSTISEEFTSTFTRMKFDRILFFKIKKKTCVVYLLWSLAWIDLAWKIWNNWKKEISG